MNEAQCVVLNELSDILRSEWNFGEYEQNLESRDKIIRARNLISLLVKLK